MALDSYHRMAEQKDALRQALWDLAGDVEEVISGVRGDLASPKGIVDDAGVMEAAKNDVGTLITRYKLWLKHDKVRQAELRYMYRERNELRKDLACANRHLADLRAERDRDEKAIARDKRPLEWHEGTHVWKEHDGYSRHQHSINGALTIDISHPWKRYLDGE